MNQTRVQKLLDRTAISASALCMLHCLAMPFLLLAVPMLATTFMADETFHRFLALIVLPTSVIALTIGCLRHKDGAVLGLGAAGLGALVLVAFFGHERLTEGSEKAATLVSGVILAVAHVRNYSLCRRDACGS
ncbi:MerC domain-containing protein [Methyloversatilis discipulorum]|uniref:MerC domain-containing protein n=1 Tax=Methyloversatilis discipulorum TaxID=1119528 RepID=UPI001A46E963|nr:MerC domain-containing protein [Methyloversatilis discipulorum]MBL8466222.1 MerC domain-containing protein [Methyloversatilis discipulorum]